MLRSQVIRPDRTGDKPGQTRERAGWLQFQGSARKAINIRGAVAADLSIHPPVVPQKEGPGLRSQDAREVRLTNTKQQIPGPGRKRNVGSGRSQVVPTGS